MADVIEVRLRLGTAAENRTYICADSSIEAMVACGERSGSRQLCLRQQPCEFTPARALIPSPARCRTGDIHDECGLVDAIVHPTTAYASN
jgi:hypothetical protein